MFSKIFRTQLRKLISPRVRIVRYRRVRRVGSLGGGRKTYLANKEAARALVHRKLEAWNAHYGFTYRKVFIKNQRSRWGSCSRQGNLNFNYRIVQLPEHLSDYLIVHELCHLKEMNHSKRFWDLVAETIPDHVQRRSELQHFGKGKAQSTLTE